MWIAGLFNLLSTGLGNLFGLRQDQANVVQEALKTISSADETQVRKQEAIAQVIAAEANSGFWLAAVWRPILMVVCMVIVISFWFGYMPPGITNEMPPIVAEIFTLLKIGVGGYIGGRSVEKVAKSFSAAKILQEFVRKKL